MSIDGMIFDMDGTLFDSEKQYIDGYYNVARKWGLEMPREFPFECMGLPANKVEQKYRSLYGNDFDFFGFKAEMMEHLHTEWDKNGIPKIKGTVEFLEYLKKNKIPCAVATSTRRQSAVPMLKSAGIFEYFDAVVCGDEIEHGKPNPDIFKEAARRCGIPPERCGGAEDSKSGIIAVRRAEMTSFFMKDFLPIDDEIKAAADYICKDMFDVMEIFKKINSCL